jgi:hypothetical protein
MRNDATSTGCAHFSLSNTNDVSGGESKLQDATRNGDISRQRTGLSLACCIHVGGVASLVRLSRATVRNIRQNVTVSLGLKAVFLVTTLVGVTGLWPAILADMGATVLVTMNALRLLHHNKEHF